MAGAGHAARAWQRMLSGRRLDLLDPSPLDVEIEDIAHGLARVSRWNGQTFGDHAFSVAQHCLLVEAVFRSGSGDTDPSEALAALLHDAPEYVIGDMISPFKAVVGGGYKTVERRLQRAIHMRFSLPGDLPDALAAAIKRADRIAAYFEATELAGFSEREAASFFGRPRGLHAADFDLAPQPAGAVQKAFLARFAVIERLRAARGESALSQTAAAPADR
ncbi:HD family hydrolase [Aquibium sp. A9E412]|uniref:HD family hydrolase n=1 Tax=Aquibium sp. A9E412 TaxID=2976767 RepID=UPI0025B0898A|nr:HD family hydrolase [Aquibium sp. A9E412]MDN2567159.1 HD family hydrolase [Aquibium sp. A9E412]